MPPEPAQAAESQGETPHPPRSIAFLAEAGVGIRAVCVLGMVQSFWRQLTILDAPWVTLRDVADRFDAVEAKLRSLTY